MGSTTAYVRRNKILLKLGFKSYLAYLKSPKWKKIRRKVFARKGPYCAACQVNKATQIHHQRYAEDDLRGRTIDYLYPICLECHQDVERSKGKKVSHGEARRRFAIKKKVADRLADERRRDEAMFEEYVAIVRNLPLHHSGIAS